MSGLSWFAVLETSSLPPATVSQAQPLPKRDMAAPAICSLNFVKSPNVFLIASASAPAGSPPQIGRASCRGRGEISVVAVSLKKKKKKKSIEMTIYVEKKR